MTKLNLFKYFKASLSSPQVILPCPDGPLSHEVPSTVISAANNEVKEVIATCNSCINCKWIVCISFRCWQASISSCIGNHHPYIRGISSHTNETKSPGVSIAHSLPLCDKVFLRQHPLRFHENCSVSY